MDSPLPLTADERLWWLSWEQPGEDYRALTWPPPESIRAYWCTGSGEGYDTVVALVRAPTLEAAWAAVHDPGAWPDAGTERFGDAYPDASKPPGDRFPPPSPRSPMAGRWPWRAA